MGAETGGERDGPSPAPPSGVEVVILQSGYRFQQKFRLALSAGGVALALGLMLALDALLAGSEEDLVAYIEQSGADVFVAQEGVKNMHMAASALSLRELRLASHAEGVASASPILYPTSVVETGGADVLAYDPAGVAAAVMARNDGMTALARPDFSREERQIIKDMSVEVLNIMNLSGLLIGLAVAALTLYTSTLRKRQEYGVLKAIGARNRHLYAVVATQAFLSLALGFVLAVSLVWLLGQGLPLAVPGVALSLTQTAVLRVFVASLVIGVIAALVPAWQMARLDPAQVFST